MNQEFPIGSEVTVEIETPRFCFVKRRADGGVDFISPFPSLFNYGFLPGTRAADGDPQDALLLGRRRARGERVRGRVEARVRFVDAGECDDKLVCSEGEDGALGVRERWALRAFFTAYATFKRALHALRGRRGRTAYEGIEEGPARVG